LPPPDESESHDPEPAPGSDILRSSEAGGRVIRGSAVRGLGHLAGIAIGVATSVLLLRHLGLVEFGRYATVASLLGIVALVTDAGLTAVGARELSILPPGRERDRLLSALLSLRLLTATAGVLVAVAFAAAAYDTTLLTGAALVGTAVVITSLQSMATLPLYVGLRIPAIALLELGRHALTLVGVAALVGAGATLLPFFAVQIGVGAILLVLTIAVIRRTARLVPRFETERVRRLVRDTLPLSVAVTMSALYFGALVVIVSKVGSATDTGLFGTSARVMEVLVALPALVLSVALPVFSVAGHEDEARLRFAVQRVAEVGLLVAALMVLAIAIVAERAIVLVGGAEYEDAGAVLRIQAFALLGVFVTQTIQLALIALRLQRALIVANTTGFVLVVVLGLALVPWAGARGAAVAAVAAEAVLAATLLLVLFRARPAVLPDFRFAWRVAIAAGCAGTAFAIPGLSPWPRAAVAAAIYVVVAFAVRAVPRELLDALLAPASDRWPALTLRLTRR
jgi:O-antigen/teichoic acid export membrane protein